MHVIDSGGVYGAENVLLTLASEQQRLGMAPLIANISTRADHPKPLLHACERRGIPAQSFFMSAGYSRRGVQDLFEFARERNVDVIHSHGYKGDILLASSARLKKIRSAVVSTVHGFTSTSAFTRMSVYEWLDGYALRRMDRVAAVSQKLGRHPRLGAIDRGRLRVIHNGIESQSAAAPAGDETLLRFCGSGFVIGTIGRLSPEKAQHRLVRAVRLLRDRGHDARLLLLGAGRLRAELEQLAVQLAVKDAVLLAGYRPDAANYLPHLSVFALPSLTEGLPMVLLEAMRARVPIIASAVGGIPEILEDGRSAQLLASGTPEEIAERCERLIHAPALGRQLTDAAAAVVAERLSSVAMARQYQALYQDALRERRAEHV